MLSVHAIYRQYRVKDCTFKHYSPHPQSTTTCTLVPSRFRSIYSNTTTKAIGGLYAGFVDRCKSISSSTICPSLFPTIETISRFDGCRSISSNTPSLSISHTELSVLAALNLCKRLNFTRFL